MPEIQSYFEPLEITLAAGETAIRDLNGQNLYCLECSGPFSVEFFSATTIPGKPLARTGTFNFGVGLGVDFDGRNFTKIVIRNQSATRALTASLLYGANAKIIDRRLNVVPNRGVSILAANDYTRLYPSGIASLGAGTELSLTGVATQAEQKFRKSVIITNNDPTVTNFLTLQSATGPASGANLLAYIYGNYRTLEFETSDAVFVRNGTAGAISVAISEAWYVNTQP